MTEADRSRTDTLARALYAERERARQYLWTEMEKMGLHKSDGWSIVEFTREDKGGTQIVMRPIHMTLPTPDGLECIVGVVEDDGVIHADCISPHGLPSV